MADMEQSGTAVETWVYTVFDNKYLARVGLEDQFQHVLSDEHCRLEHFILMEEVVHTRREISVV